MDQFRFANYPEIIPKPVPKQDQAVRQQFEFRSQMLEKPVCQARLPMFASLAFAGAGARQLPG